MVAGLAMFVTAAHWGYSPHLRSVDLLSSFFALCSLCFLVSRGSGCFGGGSGADGGADGGAGGEADTFWILSRFCCLRAMMYLVGPVLITTLSVEGVESGIPESVMHETDLMIKDTTYGLVACGLILSDAILYHVLDLSQAEMLAHIVCSIIRFVLVFDCEVQDDGPVYCVYVGLVHAFIFCGMLLIKIKFWKKRDRRKRQDDRSRDAAIAITVVATSKMPPESYYN